MLLTAAGYDVTTAEHGFDALLQIKEEMPDLIISDLNMPQMSGFEFLSVVRRRFPEIMVIAVSGAYESGDNVPGGVIADAFYAKGSHHPDELLRTVAELVGSTEARELAHHRKSAPVWIPRNGKDSKGVPFIVLTCTECLRSFPLSVLQQGSQEIQERPVCSARVRSDTSLIFPVRLLRQRRTLREKHDAVRQFEGCAETILRVSSVHGS
jgi:CheY-like chemotaxis protein